MYARRSQPVGILCLIRANLLSCGLALGLNGLCSAEFVWYTLAYADEVYLGVIIAGSRSTLNVHLSM